MYCVKWWEHHIAAQVLQGIATHNRRFRYSFERVGTWSTLVTLEHHTGRSQFTFRCSSWGLIEMRTITCAIEKLLFCWYIMYTGKMHCWLKTGQEKENILRKAVLTCVGVVYQVVISQRVMVVVTIIWVPDLLILSTTICWVDLILAWNWIVGAQITILLVTWWRITLAKINIILSLQVLRVLLGILGCW